MKDWLENIKVGDKVIVSARGWGLLDRIGEVERLTKTQIILKGTTTRYRRSDGRMIGGTALGGNILREGSEEAISSLRKKIRISDIARKLSGLHADTWKKLGIEDLEKVYAIVSAKQDKEG